MNNSLPEPDVPSPCVGVCQIDDAGLCEGCCRNLAEIANWLQMSGKQKQETVGACQRRHNQKLPRNPLAKIDRNVAFRCQIMLPPRIAGDAKEEIAGGADSKADRWLSLVNGQTKTTAAHWW